GCGIEPVVMMRRPLARCHHRSGSSGGTAARLKMAVKRSQRSTSPLETRRSAPPTTAIRACNEQVTGILHGPSAGVAHDAEDESRQGQHPSPAPGLVAQPMQPFEAALAHPARSPPSSAGDEVEGSTYPHPDDGAGPGQVAGEPGLFRGGAP